MEGKTPLLKASLGVLAKNHKDLEIYSMILKKCSEKEKKGRNGAIALKALKLRVRISF
jgi:hypothetical protein